MRPQELRLPVADALGIARAELRSPKQLPQLWVSGGDLLAFDADAAGQAASSENLKAALRRIFDRCGLPVVETGDGFMAPIATGEDVLARCPGCGCAANMKRAWAKALPQTVEDPDGDLPAEPFHTPGRKTIAEVAEFTSLPGSSQMKSLVLVADGSPVLVMVRGDDQMSGPRFLDAVGAYEYRPATPAEITGWFGAEPGSLGPVGAPIRTIADSALKGRRNMVSGANRTDYHLRNVTPGRDFQPEYFDLRRAQPGDPCGHCGTPLIAEPAVELGRIRKLGGDAFPFVCLAEISVERMLHTAIETGYDENGICLPRMIAPFDVVVTPVNAKDDALRAAAESIVTALEQSGIDVLYDDRDERPGVKFKDSDLIGIPWRVTIGGKKLAQGLVELYNRRTREVRDLSPAAAVQDLKESR